MTFPIVASVTAMAVMLVIFGVYSVLTDLFLRDRSRLTERVGTEFLRQQRDQVKKSPLFKNLGNLAAEALADDEGRPGMRKRFHAMVEQSGLNLTPGRLLIYALFAGLTAGLLGYLVRRSALIALAATPFGAVLPILFVAFMRNRRLEKLRGQLPEAFDLMARVIRAGQTMTQALQAVADEFPMPISAEFAYCFEQQNLGLPPEVTYRDMTRRCGLIELKIFVLAILIQQQTGGNLAELLGKLSFVVRDRFRIRGVIKTLTAEGRLQGMLLLILPPGMFVVMVALNPDYALGLLEHPILILITACSELVGAFFIWKIVNFDF